NRWICRSFSRPRLGDCLRAWTYLPPSSEPGSVAEALPVETGDLPPLASGTVADGAAEALPPVEPRDVEERSLDRPALGFNAANSREPDGVSSTRVMKNHTDVTTPITIARPTRDRTTSFFCRLFTGSTMRS